MATNYPGSLDTSTQQPSPSASTEMDDSGFEHDAVHTNHSGAIIALETKVGTGDSNAVANSVLAGTGSGTSAWTTGALANDISGNAATATALETARTINGTSFDGTGNITVTAAAGTLTGSSLNSGVTASSLTSVGTLTSLTTSGDVTGTSNTNFFVGNDSGEKILFQESSNSLYFQTNGTYRGYFTSGGDFVPYANGTYDIGTSSLKWQHAYLNFVHVDEVRGSDGSATDAVFTFTSVGDTGMYRSGTNQLSFTTGGSEAARFPSAGDLRLQREGVVLDASGKSYWSKSPPTGTGNDAEWTAAFGFYYLRRNSSVAADKVNITSDLGTHLTADMIDSVVPKMWARKETPTYPEIGPIADDMDTISPFLVTRGTDAEGEVFMNGIDRNAYLSLLVLAVKDLRTRVADLEAA